MNKAVCFSALVIVLLVGCGNAKVGGDTAMPKSADLTGASAVATDGEYDDMPGQPGPELAIELTARASKDSYTVRDIIRVEVSVTNKSEHTLAYLLGSGSNLVPNAIQFYFHGMVPMFISAEETDDYGIQRLPAGETQTYELTFAPYLANQIDLWPGRQTSLTMFRNNPNYRKVEPGDYECRVIFTCAVLAPDAEDPFMAYDQAEKITLEQNVSIVIQ